MSADEHDGFGPVRPRSRFEAFIAGLQRGDDADAAAIAAGGTGRPEAARARRCAAELAAVTIEDARELAAEAARALQGGRPRSARRLLVASIAMQQVVVDQLEEATDG